MEKPFALIVEDDRDIAALFRHVLDVAGYRTEIVMDGRDAVERLKTARPDIVLLDLTLPGIPGQKILERVRADPGLRDIPVLVVTAHSHIADSLPVEPDLVLLKPVNLSQLSDLVQRLRNTPSALGAAPWDPVTHLYNEEFFRVRLSYSLERARQIGTNRFGVMFVDLWPFAMLHTCLEREQLEIFLREIAGHLKTGLRPTDTVSHFDDGRFLILIEDMPDYSMPAAIVARIDRALNTFISQRNLMDGLRANVALLVCHAGYESVDEILEDVEIACRLSLNGQARSEYQRDALRKLRTR
jgi:two-component system, OmpR family, phosphate regulon response regulator PhoB